MADIELELRRLGGIDGVLNLLHLSAGLGSAGSCCADRIELGAALLACRIAETRGGKKCGTTTRASSSPCHPRIEGEKRASSRGPMDGSTTTSMDTSWEPKALVFALDALQGVLCVRSASLRPGCRSIGSRRINIYHPKRKLYEYAYEYSYSISVSHKITAFLVEFGS